MEDNLEETNFDYIVLGTGLIESILAGSLARVGKKVLHLDSHQNYGGNWSVFGFRELAQWCLNRTQVKEYVKDETSINYEESYGSNFRKVELKLYPNQQKEMDLDCSKVADMDKDLVDIWFKQLDSVQEKNMFMDLLKASRSYNLDSTPKLLGSRDSLVETLISSGVGRYLEFKSVDDIYIFDKELKSLEKVPSSKEDVFTNKAVSLIEKRKLMKFLTFAMEYDINHVLLEGTQAMSYIQFLQEKFKITGKLQEAIVYAIAMVDDKASVKTGLVSTHKFVQAMGRFGKGAYLCPLYGGGSEIAQAFCRVCAVYGGIYILNQPLEKYMIDSETNEIRGIVTKEGQEYKCQKLITGIDYLNASWLSQEKEFGTWVSRAMIVTNTPLASTDKENFVADGLSYAVFPPGSDAGNSDEPIYSIHQSQESMACPKGQYVTYLWTTSKQDAVVKNAVDLLLQNNEQHNVFTVFYEQRVRSTKGLELPKNIIPCSDPDQSLNFQGASEEAFGIFKQCEPQAEFMPASEQDQDEDY
ncbi:GDP dissociation inhibitor [Thamnidium elegans]|nr:GDP dissociation inhibitor [Thamnidium elegans]